MIQYLPYIYTIGAAQGVILALALWRKNVNAASNKILSLWLLFLAFDLIMKSIYLADNHTLLITLYRIIQFFPFLYASFFYIYVKSLIRQQNFNGRDLIHFGAFIVFFGINLPAIIMKDFTLVVGLRYFDEILYVCSVSYVIAGVRLISNYRKDLQQQRVDTQDIDLRWLNIMGYSQILIWAIAVSQWLLPLEWYNNWSIYIAVSLWMIMTGYLSLLQQNIPVIEPLRNTKKIHETQNHQKFDEVKEKLDQLIEEEKIHLSANLTIGSLAKASGYPEYLISLFINRKHGVNFHDFINQLRIDEAQKMLMKSGEQRTILEIAYDCGYNSKSTFNTAFKKFAKQTPSQFRQMHQSS